MPVSFNWLLLVLCKPPYFQQAGKQSLNPYSDTWLDPYQTKKEAGPTNRLGGGGGGGGGWSPMELVERIVHAVVHRRRRRRGSSLAHISHHNILKIVCRVLNHKSKKIIFTPTCLFTLYKIYKLGRRKMY